MKRKNIRFVAIAVTAIILVLLFICGVFCGGPKDIVDGYTKYTCDVKNLRLSTTVDVKQGDEKIGTISGNIFALITDPLTLNDTSGNRIAYAGDDYHFIAQDSHSIYLNDGLAVEMVGKVKLLGEKYEIYDGNQTKIATVTFNYMDTAGEMYDESGNLIATYEAWPFMNDYTVKVSDKCKIDDNAALMIFASYYSDRTADAKASNSSSSNHHSK